MAKITLPENIMSIHGHTGGMVFYFHSAYEIQYVRSYVIPRNPRTALQQKGRTAFGGAVRLWQQLQPGEKSFYNRMAYGKPLSGYNMFISMQKRGLTTEILKLINKHLRYSRFDFDSCMIRISSVPGLTIFTKNPVLPQQSINLHNKPPGELAIAS